MSAPFPWQAAQWERLSLARRTARMPHALLLTGHRGRGVPELARRLAAALLCLEPLPDGGPCGHCTSCALSDAGHHPELAVLAPEAEGKAIKVDQIRQLVDFVALKPVYGAFKVALIDPADAMNRQSANALLKTLEEPPPRTVLILCAERRASLPLTVQSRCQRLDFPPVPPDLARDWLAARIAEPAEIGTLMRLYDHAPLAVLAAHEKGELGQRDQILADLEALALRRADPVEVAARWSGLDMVSLWLLRLLGDVAAAKLGPRGRGLQNLDRRDRIEALAAPLDPHALFAAYEGLLEQRLSLWWGDLVDVRVDDQAVEAGEPRGVQFPDVFCVRDSEAAISQGRNKSRRQNGRTMMPAVAEEQQLQRRVRGRRQWCDKEQT
jgi:DNA polymerase-3 subunit delta'